MPKMGVKRKVISMTKSDAWTTPYPQERTDIIKSFCYERCPHPDKPCKGDCPEMKEFRRNNGKRRAKVKED